MDHHSPLSQRSSTDTSGDPLLEEEYASEKSRLDFRTRKGRFATFLPSILLNLFFIVLYTGIYIVATQTPKNAEAPELYVDSPAIGALKPELKLFDYRPTSTMKLFGSPPSEATDEAWDDIMDFSNIKFSASEMARYGRSHEGVGLADGSGFMGTLNVYHELHCIRRLYMWMFRDKYFSNLTATEEKFFLHHNLHCLDTLRQGSQCRIDISPVTYQWGEYQRLPIANFSSPHECRNWDEFEMWSKRNSFDPMWPGLIVHPKFGPAYAETDSVGAKSGLVIDKPAGQPGDEGEDNKDWEEHYHHHEKE